MRNVVLTGNVIERDYAGGGESMGKGRKSEEEEKRNMRRSTDSDTLNTLCK